MMYRVHTKRRIILYSSNSGTAVIGMQEGKSDVECMTILKEAYVDAMVLLGFFDLLRRGGIAPPQHLPIVSLQNQAIK